MMTIEETKGTAPFRFRHLGYGFYWACNLICFQSTVLFSSVSDAPSSVTVFLLVSIIFSVLTHFASAALILQFPNRFVSLHPLPAGLVVAVGVICAVLAGYSNSYSNLFLVSAGVLTGIGNAWSNIAWFHFYGATRPERTSLYIPVVFILAIALYFIINFMSAVSMAGAIAIVVVCPLVAGALLSTNIKEIQASSFEVESPKQYVLAAQMLWRIIIGAAIFSVVFGMVWQ
ncbi:MAG: hypothetical protein HGA54_06905, partial [Actinobacteria bacterium]|nr:hypothetical protein [Actinomycetota bacterium]